MLKFCSRSCGVCPHFGVDSNDFRTNDDACRDLKETIECEKFAKLGHCLLNHTFMEDNCRATCFFCVNEKSLKEAGFSKPEMYVQLKCQVSFNDTFSHITFFVRDRRLNYKSMNLGVRQINPGRDPVEKRNTIARIKSMDEYSKSRISDPMTHSKTRSLCTNNLSYCAYYASKGMCYSHNIFMTNNCPLACMVCETLEEFLNVTGKGHPSKDP